MSLRGRAKLADETRSIGPPGGWSDYLAWWSSNTDGGTIEQALRNAASWACIDVIADAIARTPFKAVRRDGDRRVPIEPVPKILAEPSGVVGDDVFKYQLAFGLVTDGNSFGQIVKTDSRQFPTQIELLASSAVLEREVKDGIPRVRVDGHGWENVWPFGSVWHVPGRVVPPGSPFAMSPVRYASKVLGTSLAVGDFSNRFFTDGGHPTMAFMLDSDPGQDTVDLMAQKIMRAMAGGSRRPLFLGAGIKTEKLQLDPSETQFIPLAQELVLDACRFWRVPPGMVYAAVSGQNVTYANVTQFDLTFLKHTLDGYFVRVESAYSRCLPKPQFVRATRDAILRADPLARAQVQDIRLKNRTTTINEVRADEDEAPFADPLFDDPGIPAVVPTGAPDA